MVWSSGHGMVRYGIARHGMVSGMSWLGWHGMAWFMLWPGKAWNGILYVLAGMAWYMVWPGGHDMGKGMAWRAWHSIWLGLTMHGMEYGMTWLAWHAIWYGLVGSECYRVWSGMHTMVYGMALWVWRGI